MADIGIDIVRMPRIEHLLHLTFGNSILALAFLPYEYAVLMSLRASQRVFEIASGFAIKEAVIKASNDELTIADFQKIAVAIEDKRPMSGAKRAIVRGQSFHISVSRLGQSALAIAGL